MLSILQSLDEKLSLNNYDENYSSEFYVGQFIGVLPNTTPEEIRESFELVHNRFYQIRFVQGNKVEVLNLEKFKGLSFNSKFFKIFKIKNVELIETNQKINYTENTFTKPNSNFDNINYSDFDNNIFENSKKEKEVIKFKGQLLYIQKYLTTNISVGIMKDKENTLYIIKQKLKKQKETEVNPIVIDLNNRNKNILNVEEEYFFNGKKYIQFFEYSSTDEIIEQEDKFKKYNIDDHILGYIYEKPKIGKEIYIDSFEEFVIDKFLNLEKRKIEVIQRIFKGVYQIKLEGINLTFICLLKDFYEEELYRHEVLRY